MLRLTDFRDGRGAQVRPGCGEVRRYHISCYGKPNQLANLGLFLKESKIRQGERESLCELASRLFEKLLGFKFKGACVQGVWRAKTVKRRSRQKNRGVLCFAILLNGRTDMVFGTWLDFESAFRLREKRQAANAA